MISTLWQLATSAEVTIVALVGSQQLRRCALDFLSAGCFPAEPDLEV